MAITHSTTEPIVHLTYMYVACATYVHIFYIVKIKIHSSCEIEYFVETAGVVTKTTDRDSLRYTYNGIRRVRQLALGCESN